VKNGVKKEELEEYKVWGAEKAVIRVRFRKIMSKGILGSGQ
jgi:hypothetical protein